MKKSVSLVGALAYCLAGQVTNAQLTMLLQRGDALPDDTTNTFVVLDVPRMNMAGEVTFEASTSLDGVNDKRIFLIKDGSVQQLTRSGQQAPDLNGNLYRLADDPNGDLPRIAGNGDVVFVSSLSGTLGGHTDDNALYLHRNGGLVQVAREGAILSDGSRLMNEFESVRVSEQGDVLFIADSQGSSGNSFFSGLYWYSNGQLNEIAKPGSVMPDNLGQMTASGVRKAAFLPNGHVLFVAGVPNYSQVVFLFDGSALQTVVRNNQTLPDNNGYFLVIDPGTHEAIGANSSGDVVFAVDLFGTSGSAADNSAIIKCREGEITVLARKGQLVPGSNGRFLSFALPGDVSMNEKGQTVFFANLSGTVGGSNNAAIYLSEGTLLREVVRTGGLSPDGNGTFSAFGVPTINNRGQILFRAQLSGSVGGTSDDIALFMAEADGTITMVVREGQAEPGFTVLAIPAGSDLFNGTIMSGQNTGGTSSFDDQGNIVFRSTLTGPAGQWAIFMWSKPSISRIDHSVSNAIIRFSTTAGATNYLQASPGLEPTGEGFSDISGPVTITGVGRVSTNFVENIADPRPARRFYRVRSAR